MTTKEAMGWVERRAREIMRERKLTGNKCWRLANWIAEQELAIKAWQAGFSWKNRMDYKIEKEKEKQ